MSGHLIKPPIAIIGGSGFDSACMQQVQIETWQNPDTPWGRAGRIATGQYDTAPVLLLQRHGEKQRLPPHAINYRANLHALHALGAKQIIAINVVGGISVGMNIGDIVIPDQIIDYTTGRDGSFHDAASQTLQHIDFSTPYCETLRHSLLQAGARARVQMVAGGVHGITQGPRLETAAEIRRMERDGCHIVGMTGMPEAALARELGCSYACCALVVNPASGKSQHPLDLPQIHEHIESGMIRIGAVLRQVLHHYRNAAS